MGNKQFVSISLTYTKRAYGEIMFSNCFAAVWQEF